MSAQTAMLPDISGTDESSTDELLKWVNAQLPDSVSKATSFTNSFRSGEVIYNLIKSCSGTSKAELEVPSRFNNVSMDHVDVIFDLFDYMLEQQIDTREVSMAELLQGHEDQTRNLVDSINSKYA